MKNFKENLENWQLFVKKANILEKVIREKLIREVKSVVEIFKIVEEKRENSVNSSFFDKKGWIFKK